jgi:hypothetical protein
LLQRLALEKEWRSPEGAEPKAEQALLNESKPKVELMLTKEPEPTTEQECLEKPEFKQEQAGDIENFKKALEDRDHQNIINLLTKRSGMERLKFKEYVEYSYATDSINKSMRKECRFRGILRQRRIVCDKVRQEHFDQKGEKEIERRFSTFDRGNIDPTCDLLRRRTAPRIQGPWHHRRRRAGNSLHGEQRPAPGYQKALRQK